MAEAKEIRAEVKDKTGPLDSFLKSVGIGSGLCIGLCIGIVVLIFIIAFLVGLGSTPDKNTVAVENNPANQSSGQTSVNNPAAVAPKNEFEADSLSKSIEVGGVTVKILNSYTVPTDKKTRYYFEISSENNSTEDVYTPSNSSFQIEDTDKYVTDSQIAFGLDDSYPYYQKLGPGQKIKGYIFFEMNKTEKPAVLILKQWNLFDNDKQLKWKIQDSEIKAAECMTNYECPNSLYQTCTAQKCEWKEGSCGTSADCKQGERCLYNTCSSSLYG